MNVGTRLGLYGLGLVAAFGASYAIAGVVVPEGFVTEWSEQANHSPQPQEQPQQSQQQHSTEGTP